MSLNHKSQSALEYMMTYGWAILVIVIVAGVLYSLGIFSPSSSLSTTITGFSGLAVTQVGCVNSVNNQILELYVTNAVGYPVNITKINTTGNNGIDASQNISSILGDGDSAVFYVNGACNKSSSYAGSATITYTEPGQIFPGPYLSTGKVSNVPVSADPNQVASFNGQSTTTISNIPYSSFPSGSHALTIVAWVKTTQDANYPFILNYGSYGNDYMDGILGIYSGQVCGDFWGEHLCSTATVSGGTWDLIAFSYPGGSASTTTYINESGTINSVSVTPNIQVGSGTIANIGYGTGIYYDGEISNVQLYSTALSSPQIDKLYVEGLGGAPIPNAGLVGWWPLDGNANDYSGNNNNGVATNVQWVSP
ncbi:MAG: LamG domain-containing protein [Candidatus Parvarchaeota archaeon]|nr:LamG domain-containing protein [Candidatus Parvarchaeota archaeon]